MKRDVDAINPDAFVSLLGHIRLVYVLRSENQLWMETKHESEIPVTQIVLEGDNIHPYKEKRQERNNSINYVKVKKKTHVLEENNASYPCSIASVTSASVMALVIVFCLIMRTRQSARKIPFSN